MATAVFCDLDGYITHIVKTDGANADRDLKVHTDAVKPGHSVVVIDDDAYAKMSHQDFIACVLKSVPDAKMPPPAPAPPAEAPEKSKARLQAFNDAQKKGADFATAMAAAEQAAVSIALLSSASIQVDMVEDVVGTLAK